MQAYIIFVLKVGAARRQDILHRQEKTIKDLEV